MPKPIDAAFWYAKLNLCVLESQTMRTPSKRLRGMRQSAGTPSHPSYSRVLIWLAREPLTHFIALGVLIFAVYGLLHPQNTATERSIEVSAADLARLRASAIKQWGKEPDAQQMSDLLQTFVREEVLYREALVSGLDRDDVIVRRRLAQKMEFLAQQEVRAPTEAELREYYTRHAAEYSQAASLDFEQLFFSREHSLDSALENARTARLALLRGSAVASDRFMLGKQLQGQEHANIARDFGAPFAQAVFGLHTGVWSEALISAHGVHLVRIAQHRPAAPARFEEVRGKIAADMVNARVTAARENAYQKLLGRYSVLLPQSGVQASAPPSSTAKP